MKIEGNSADVRRISGGQTDMAHSIFVDAVDSHVKTDIVRDCVLNVLHDGVVGITANGVVPLAVTVQTEQNQVSFRKLERKSAVGDNIDDQKTHFLCFDDQLPQGTVTVMPEEGFTSAKEENAHAHIVKLLHLCTNLRVGIKNRVMLLTEQCLHCKLHLSVRMMVPRIGSLFLNRIVRTPNFAKWKKEEIFILSLTFL